MQENNGSESKYIENRKYPRLPIKIKFQCEVIHDDLVPEDGLLHFYWKDLCCGGVFLEDDLDVSEGSIVNLEFNLPLTKQPIKVKGLVLRSNDEGAGIRFLTLDINDFATIDDYVQNQLS